MPKSGDIIKILGVNPFKSAPYPSTFTILIKVSITPLYCSVLFFTCNLVLITSAGVLQVAASPPAAHPANNSFDAGILPFSSVKAVLKY